MTIKLFYKRSVIYLDKIIAYTRVSKSIIELLEQSYDVIYFQNYEQLDDPLFKKELQDAVGIIGLELKVNQKLLQHAPNLKIVSNVSAGYDNLDLDAITKAGILATNTPNVLTDTVADAMVGLMLATSRRIPELHQFVQQGKWKEYLQTEYFGVDMHHKKVGIIGLGGIGEAIAKRCHFGFDMDILYHKRSRDLAVEQKYDARFCSLEDLLKESDFIVLMVPATKETEKMISTEQFKLMKKSAIFINGSRGINVDEEALYKAIIHQEILAAGLDVFDQEPIDMDNPLLHLPNVVTTPHIGAATIENELAMSTLAMKNLTTGLQGKKPPNLLNEKVWDFYEK